MSTEGASRSCAKCGAQLAPAAAFCRSCGTPYTPPEPEAPAKPEPPTQVLPPTDPKPPVHPLPPVRPEPPTQPLQRPPSPPPPPAPPSPQQKTKRWGRVALIAVAALMLFGAGAGGAVLLLGGDDSGEETEEQTVVSSVPVDGDTASQGSGEATSGEGGSELDAQSEVEMASEIQTVLLAFHELVVAGDYRDAWALLTDRKRQQYLREGGYPKWANAQSTLTEYLGPSGLTVRVDGIEADGSARVLLSGMSWSEPGATCTEWNGLTWANYEHGVWRYDPGYSTKPERRRVWEPQKIELLGERCLD
ncbi:MAG: hypothetical protein WD827_00920 [Solirubrobacterales bacterium]